MEKHQFTGKDYAKHDIIQGLLNQAKGQVCKEFEKVCPTELAFKRMKKEMHDIFDKLLEDLKETV